MFAAFSVLAWTHRDADFLAGIASALVRCAKAWFSLLRAVQTTIEWLTKLCRHSGEASEDNAHSATGATGLKRVLVLLLRAAAGTLRFARLAVPALIVSLFFLVLLMTSNTVLAAKGVAVFNAFADCCEWLLSFNINHIFVTIPAAALLAFLFNASPAVTRS